MHGGDIYSGKVDIDLSINCNPLGMPASFREAYDKAYQSLTAYPDLLSRSLREKIGAYHRVDADRIVCGNGASELIQTLCYAIKPKSGMITAPSFSGYERALSNVGCDIYISELREEEDYLIGEPLIKDIKEKRPDIVFVANPNNPNGRKIDRATGERLIEACRESGSFLVIDECFVELTKEGEGNSLKDMLGTTGGAIGGTTDRATADIADRAVIIRSFTKAYAIPGIRLGYAICSNKEIAKLITESLPEWNISIPATVMGEKALEEGDYLERGRETVAEGLSYLTAELEARGMKVYPSDTAYILFRLPNKKANLYEKMKARGILIRDCSDYRALEKGYYRIAIRNREINDRFLKILDEVMSDE